MDVAAMGAVNRDAAVYCYTPKVSLLERAS